MLSQSTEGEAVLLPPPHLTTVERVPLSSERCGPGVPLVSVPLEMCDSVQAAGSSLLRHKVSSWNERGNVTLEWEGKCDRVSGSPGLKMWLPMVCDHCKHLEECVVLSLSGVSTVSLCAPGALLLALFMNTSIWCAQVPKVIWHHTALC